MFDTRTQDGRSTKTAKQAVDLINKDSGVKGPHAWIQWKGTDVCMDIRCKCGDLTHVDASFAYGVKCASCGRTYVCNPHVELVEFTNHASSKGEVLMVNSESG